MREQYHLLSSPPFLIELHESDKLLTRHALIACPYIFPLINYEVTLFKTMGYILCSYLYLLWSFQAFLNNFLLFFSYHYILSHHSQLFLGQSPFNSFIALLNNFSACSGLTISFFNTVSKATSPSSKTSLG